MNDTAQPKTYKKPQGKPIYKSLFFQVIVAIILGIIFGHFAPEKAQGMKPFGDAFINLIKMLIAPIIFCTIVSGIAGMGDVKQVGRVGVKAILWFEIITTIALIIGWIVAELAQPGMGMMDKIDLSSIDVNSAKEKVAGAHLDSTKDFFMHMIPSTLVGAFANGELLQVLLVAILFSIALTGLGDKVKPIHALIDSTSHVLFRMVDIVTKFAPIGAFGAIAYTIGKFGIGSLKDLGSLLLLFYGTCIGFIIFVLAPVMHFYCKLSVFQFIKYIREELFIVLGTSSSESVLPRLMEKMAAMGCEKKVVGLTIPAGYSFNLDGSSLYFIMGGLFITYATNTPITFWQEVALLGVLLITSKGAAGVSGSAFLVLAATMASMNIVSPDKLNIGLALLLAIDRFMSTGRAIVNIIGNGVATIVVAKWENELDHKLAHNVLTGKVEADLEVLEK